LLNINIDGREIGPAYPPYIIAEMSGNHNGSLERGKKIIKAAKDAGADAVKLQTYTAETMTLDIDHPRFRVQGKNPWDGNHLFDLYKRAGTPWEWHAPLFEFAREIGITIFSSPFDSTAIELLESLNAPAYKIASFELVDLNLIKLCARTGKPLIMSTGMASLAEISDAVNAAKEEGATDIILLKCTSAYPAACDDMNISTIPHLAQAFGVQAGLSDHTLGVEVPIAATVLGATLIEKHLTLSRNDGGVDSIFSLEPRELAQLVQGTRNAKAAIGEVTYMKGNEETSFKRYRRSLFFVRDLKAGDVISDNDIAALRPGDGLMPKYFDIVIGHRVKQCVSMGTPVSWDLLG